MRSRLHSWGPEQLLINDGHGFFSDETAARLPLANDQTGAMLAGDIDRDHDLDIVVLNRGQDLVLINNGRGFFTDETASRFPATSDTSRGGGLADLDGDRDLDLVVANSRNEPIALYVNRRGVFKAVDFGAGVRSAEPSGPRLRNIAHRAGRAGVEWNAFSTEASDSCANSDSTSRRRLPEYASDARDRKDTSRHTRHTRTFPTHLLLQASPPHSQLLIPLNRRDVRGVEGARLEIDSGRAQ